MYSPIQIQGMLAQINDEITLLQNDLESTAKELGELKSRYEKRMAQETIGQADNKRTQDLRKAYAKLAVAEEGLYEEYLVAEILWEAKKTKLMTLQSQAKILITLLDSMTRGGRETL